MTKKRMFTVVLAAVVLVIVGYFSFNEMSIERRIMEGEFYESNTERASEILTFSIHPKDYMGDIKGDLGERRLLMEKYDTKVYLEPIKNQGAYLWIDWSFENNWWKQTGTCFTYRAIVYENEKRLYSSVSPIFEAVDQDGNRVNEDWGGGGSTYSYGFRIKKQVFENCERINVRLSNFNKVNYKFRFNQ